MKFSPTLGIFDNFHIFHNDVRLLVMMQVSFTIPLIYHIFNKFFESMIELLTFIMRSKMHLQHIVNESIRFIVRSMLRFNNTQFIVPRALKRFIKNQRNHLYNCIYSRIPLIKIYLIDQNYRIIT